jgi:quercetin dioxygenase-like cupin family protein
LNKIGLSILTSSVALVASTLCLQAATTEQTPTGNKGLSSVDLSSEIDSARRKLRLLTLEPGGTIELHGHKDHPTILHVIKGTLTSRTLGKPEVVLRAGVGLAEDKDSNYLVQNNGSEPAEFIWLPIFETMP